MQQEGIDFEETFAPVAPLSVIRALLSLAVEHDWEVHQLDITMAYLNSTLKHEIYMKLPEGAKVPKGKAYQVIKGLYSLKQSGQEWNMEFDKVLQQSNFHRLDCAPCIYSRGKGDDFAIVVIYVDDTLIMSPKLEMVKCIKEEIGKKWKMEEGGDVSHFLGIKITRDHEEKTMDLRQTSYIKQLLDKHLDKHRRKSSILLQDILAPETAASTAERKEYLQIVGKLLWLLNGTHADISQAVGVLACYMTQPLKEHYNAAQKVLQYLDDNTATIQVSKDPAQHWKLKHIDTKYHFIRDNVQDGNVKIKYIGTEDNLANIFTKPVGKEVLQCA
ncbi:hypothetical protein NDA11_005694 [Ustilago hordei]|uniref:Reverse transcriptase Ty1/copia-type domain-containing protein n=1 Tax=Ustilago hordei TaxID=120017 RepID=I2FSR4_USTHO|nr:hypothetical protein NDA11_005694 [Ustilago hordei]KAJ1587405.1 hypothetical protein NDA15_005278 [Ustilago hordei]KAJ1590485.1 hypothetical protein NDA12_007768 [Ustilago hordei]CCF49957.1 uncharacterized protein UHOR_14059 [Ustilago hordei]